MMQTIGIGGAGGKLASKLNKNNLIINISESELGKIDSKNKYLACAHNQVQSQGQLKGSKKDPNIGRKAYESIKAKLLKEAQGKLLISSTGGGTGNGITSAFMENISASEHIEDENKTSFAFILPYANKEANEYISNTVNFLSTSLSQAVDSANTGNIFLFSNREKFQKRLSEEYFNNAIIESLREFYSIPEKGEEYELLDGHIDEEDFRTFCAKSFFNHFSSFSYDKNEDFGNQISKNYNKLLFSSRYGN